MNIVIFIHSMQSGGAERVTANLANAWASKGWDVTVLTLTGAEGDFYELDKNVHRTGLDLATNSGGAVRALFANIKRVRAVRRILIEKKADCVVGMMTTAAVLVLLATRGLRCRVIVSERSYPPLLPAGRLWDWLRCKTYPLADQVVMLTSEGLDWLHKRIPSAKGTVIPNPVPYPLTATEPKLLPEKYISADRCLLLAVGRLDAGKQFDRLLESFAVLAIRYPLWDLVILGEGSKRQALEQQLEQLGLMGRVSLPGRTGNVSDWYNRADLYVMSSGFEGFPNTLAEAMAHGCAAVSYDCDTGPRDIIRHQHDGLLVTPVSNVPALTHALNQLMGDTPERQRMAMCAKDIRHRYSIPSILAMWSKLFTEPK